jgi:tetrahydromethanopterin S-methyltransferase subunit D
MALLIPASCLKLFGIIYASLILLKNLIDSYKIGNTRIEGLHRYGKLCKIGNAMIQILELVLLRVHAAVELLHGPIAEVIKPDKYICTCQAFLSS